MKKQPKVTPWFPADVKPVRKGYYQRQYRDSCMWWPDKWDGKEWKLCNEDGTIIGPSFNDMPWRGLAFGPKASA